MRVVLKRYRHRFVELERRITTITPKVLTERLRQLERDGLVVRTYHAGEPRPVPVGHCRKAQRRSTGPLSGPAART
jgi:DNA-binding HxlR family transcriptional regulator